MGRNLDKNLAMQYQRLGSMEHDIRNKNLISLIAKTVRGKTILDIGCGSGNLLYTLKKSGKTTFGIEPNKKTIKLAPKNLNIIKGKANDIDKLFRKKADTITIIDSLEYIKNDKLLIKKAYNHLNRGGRLIIFVPAYQFLHGARDVVYGGYRRYSKKRLKSIVAENNFKIVKIRYWNMIGFLPFVFYEKILDKKLEAISLRTESKGFFSSLMKKLADLWFKYIENNINFGFGVDLICVAEKAEV